MNSPPTETPSSGPPDVTPAPLSMTHATNMDNPFMAEALVSEEGGGSPNKKPQPLFTPADAPDLPSSDADEVQPPQHKRRRNRAKAQKTTKVPLNLDDMFGTRSEAWTRFHAITGPEELDNMEIYEDLDDK